VQVHSSEKQLTGASLSSPRIWRIALFCSLISSAQVEQARLESPKDLASPDLQESRSNWTSSIRCRRSKAIRNHWTRTT
jgi:hypothetical protein